jgi:hypothetical protein
MSKKAWAGRRGITSTRRSGGNAKRPPSFLPAQADHRNASPRDLFSRHRSPTLGTSLLIAGRSYLMRRFFPALGADAVAAGTCCKTPAPVSTATSSHTSSCSRSLSPWSCAVSSWHSGYLLGFSFSRMDPMTGALIHRFHKAGNPVQWQTWGQPFVMVSFLVPLICLKLAPWLTHLRASSASITLVPDSACTP